MVGRVTTTWGTVLKGHCNRKVENHCSRKGGGPFDTLLELQHNKFVVFKLLDLWNLVTIGN